MRRFTSASVLLVTMACYHATVETGRPPGRVTLEKKWASGWVYGLVPPDVVQTAQRCPNGIARVSTQLSFANQLVGFLTLGIYTPMEIIVTCAAPGRASNPPRPLDRGQSLEVALKAAVFEVLDSKQELYVMTR